MAADRRFRRTPGRSAWWAVALWCACIGVFCAWPAAAALWSVAEGWLAGGEGARRGGVEGGLGGRVLLRSLLWAGGIGLLAALLALPLVWWTRGLSARFSWLVLLPVLLPMPLAYAGLNLLRAPGTAVGDWLAMGPAWRAVAAGRGIAVAALALWAAPIAAIVQAPAVRAVGRDVCDAMAVDGSPRLRRAVQLIAMTRDVVLASAAVATVLMLGSAVPLHLARVPTASIELWLLLDSTPADQTWRVWLSAWPLWGIASVAGVLVARHLPRRLAVSFDGQRSARPSAWTAGAAVAVLVLAAALPLVLLAFSVQRWSTFATLWRTESGAIVDSAVVAAWVGCLGAVVCLAARAAMDAAPRAVAAGAVLAAAVSLAPGILVGSTVSVAWSALPGVQASPAVLVFAHMARLLAIPALVGLTLAWAEPDEARSRRLLDGAVGVRAHLRAGGAGQTAVVLGVGVVLAMLSLSEIEASVVVSPPGRESVARSMLGMLHFARYEHLSGLMLMQAAGILAAGVLGLASAAAVRRLHRDPGEP